MIKYNADDFRNLLNKLTKLSESGGDNTNNSSQQNKSSSSTTNIASQKNTSDSTLNDLLTEPEDYPCYIFDINSDMDILTYIYKKDLELLNKLLQKSFLKILQNPLLRFSK